MFEAGRGQSVVQRLPILKPAPKAQEYTGGKGVTRADTIDDARQGPRHGAQRLPFARDQMRSQLMPLRGFRDTACEGDALQSGKMTESVRCHFDVSRRTVRKGRSVQRQGDVPMIDERGLGLRQYL